MRLRDVPGFPGTLRDAVQHLGDAMEYTLAGAAETTGISKSALHRAIQKGRLAARKLEDGTLRIDGAELARVYPPSPAGQLEPSPWDIKGQAETPRDVDGTELAVLRMRTQMLEEQLARERDTVDDLRTRLDRAEDRILALVHRPVATPVPPAPEKHVEAPTVVALVAKPSRPSWGFLARLLGR